MQDLAVDFPDHLIIHTMKENCIFKSQFSLTYTSHKTLMFTQMWDRYVFTRLSPSSEREWKIIMFESKQIFRQITMVSLLPFYPYALLPFTYSLCTSSFNLHLLWTTIDYYGFILFWSNEKILRLQSRLIGNTKYRPYITLALVCLKV